MRDVGGDRGNDLEATRAGADYGDALAPVADGVIPPCAVERRARRDRLGRAGRGADDDLPRSRAVVPTRGHDLGVPPDVARDVVARHHRREVRLDLGLSREVLGPVVTRLERVAVEVV